MKKIYGQIFSVSLLVIILDQGSKFLVSWSGLFLIHKNPGIAFSLPFTGFFLNLAVVIFIGLGLFLSTHFLDLTKFSARMLVSLVLGGAIANLIDRLRLGYVVDFIQIKFWPATFNLADLTITAGIILILLFYQKIKKSPYGKISSIRPQ